jgi:hypothetical protein
VERKKDKGLVCTENNAYAPDNDGFGPVWGNYPEKEDRVRAAFDPDHISTPS